MRTVTYLILMAAFGGGILAGCGGLAGRFGTSEPEISPDNPPGWFLKPPVDSLDLFATGLAVSENLETVSSKARKMAEMNLVRKLESMYGASYFKQRLIKPVVQPGLNQKLQTEIQRMVNIGLSASLRAISIENVQTITVGDKHYCWILVKVPAEQVEAQMRVEVRKVESYLHKLKQGESWEELEREIEKLND